MDIWMRPLGELARQELLTDPKNGNVAQKELDLARASLEERHSIKTYTIVASLLASLALIGAGIAHSAAYSHHSSTIDLSLEDCMQMGTSLLIGGTLAAYLIFAYFDKPKHSKKIKVALALVLLALAGVGLYYSGLYDGFKGKDWDHSALVLTAGALFGFSVMGIIGLLDRLNIRKKSRIKYAFDICERHSTLGLLEALKVIEDENQIKEYFKKTLKQDPAAWKTMQEHLNSSDPNNYVTDITKEQLLKVKRALDAAHFEAMGEGSILTVTSQAEEDLFGKL